MVSSAISLIQISTHFHTYHSRDRLQLLSSCHDILSVKRLNFFSETIPTLHLLSSPPLSTPLSFLASISVPDFLARSTPTLTFLFCCPDSRSMNYFICNLVRFVIVSILSFCPNNLCVELLTVSNSSLYPTYHVHVVQLVFYSTCICFNLSLCLTCHRIN